MAFDGSRGPPNIEGMTSLKVDNLTYRTGIEQLKSVFGKYGDIGDIYIPRDRKHLQSRGFAFIRFWEKRDAEDAMDLLDKSILDGREIRVQMARYGRPTETYKPRPRSGGRDSRRYRSRSRSRSPRRRRYSRSKSRSPRRRYSRSKSPARNRSRSPSPRRSRSPPPRRSKSGSPPSSRRSRSRSKSPKRRSRSGSPKRSPSLEWGRNENNES